MLGSARQNSARHRDALRSRLVVIPKKNRQVIRVGEHPIWRLQVNGEEKKNDSEGYLNSRRISLAVERRTPPTAERAYES